MIEEIYICKGCGQDKPCIVRIQYQYTEVPLTEPTHCVLDSGNDYCNCKWELVE
jgi:hypothetical protein